jgi:predicted PurR-regulated permease PerM
MKIQLDRRLFKYALHVFIVIAMAIIVYQALENMGYFTGQLMTLWKWIRRILSPFIIGIFAAYILNPGVRRFEESIYGRIGFLKDNTRIKRLLSISSMFLIVLLFFVMIFVVVTPRVISSISDIMRNFPDYMENTIASVENLEGTLRAQNLDAFFQEFQIIEEVKDWLENGFRYIRESLDEIIDMIFFQITNITSGILNFFIGMIMAFYLLYDKNIIKKNINKILYTLFSKETVYKINDFGRDADDLFGRYIVGRTIDSSIIGFIAFIGLSILGIPYRLLFSIIIGVTNMIPYFGPYLGGIPIIIVTMFSSLNEALWVALFILALQQFDGLVLGPKILGDSVGIRPIWIILSIYVGGRIFGILGMFLGVPVFAVIVMFLERLINKRLEKRGITEREAESAPPRPGNPTEELES